MASTSTTSSAAQLSSLDFFNVPGAVQRVPDNPRGIPGAPFVTNMDLFMVERKTDDAIKEINELYRFFMI
jgi:hypothetical protein